MELKPGVVLSLQRGMAKALWDIDQETRATVGRAAIITAALEERASGLHPEGRAIDMRTNDLPGRHTYTQLTAEGQALRDRLAGNIRKRLEKKWPREFDVIYESRIVRDGKLIREEHIHVEHDPKVL